MSDISRSKELILVYDNVASALHLLEKIFGSKYILTFLARYTDNDLEDADILVTKDSLDLILEALKRRIECED